MDILKTKYQKNKDKSEKMSLIMIDEIGLFTIQAHNQMKELLKIYTEINSQYGKNVFYFS